MMFGRPRCPVEPVTKAWIDDRFLAWVGLFGLEAMRSVRVVQPTEADFPEVFVDGRDPKAILRRVATHLQLEPSEVELQVLEKEDDSLPRDRWGQLTGRYVPAPEGPRIRLEEREVADPERLVARLALELARHDLERGGYLEAGQQEGGPSPEVHAILRGLGVMLANANLAAQPGIQGSLEWWKSAHLGGLDDAANGYALGLFAWLRGEAKPAWAAGLHPEVRRHLQAALKYLGKSGDALVQPQGMHRSPEALSDGQLVEWIQTGSPSTRINALWTVAARGQPGVALAAAVLANVGHDERGVREQALWTIRGTELEEGAAVPVILDGLVDTSEAVRVAAVAALAKTCSDAAVLQEELLPLLEGQAPLVVQTAALALGRRADPQAEIQQALLAGLERSLLAQEGMTTSAFLAALQENSADVRALLADSPLREDPIHACFLDDALDALESGRTPPAEAPQEPG